MRKVLEDTGFKISCNKTEYMKFCDERGMGVKLQGEILTRVNKFKYLRSTTMGNGKLDAKNTGWIKKFEDNSGVLCDKKMNVKVKSNFN